MLSESLSAEERRELTNWFRIFTDAKLGFITETMLAIERILTIHVQRAQAQARLNEHKLCCQVCRRRDYENGPECSRFSALEGKETISNQCRICMKRPDSIAATRALSTLCSTCGCHLHWEHLPEAPGARVGKFAYCPNCETKA